MFKYYTIFKDNSKEFTIALNKCAKEGYRLDRFEYREYTQRVKDEGTVVIQSYVAVMAKEVPDAPSESSEA